MKNIINFLAIILSFLLLILGVGVKAQSGQQNQLVERKFVPKPEKITLNNKQLAGIIVLKFVEGSHIRLKNGELQFDNQNLVKYKEEAARLKRSKVSDSTALMEVSLINNLLKQYNSSYGFKLNYLFNSSQNQQNEEKEFEEKQKLELAAGEELADLSLYYVLYAPNFKDIEAQEKLMNQLNKFLIVEDVHVAGISASALIENKPKHNLSLSNSIIQLPPTADITTQQGYLNPQPSGIDAYYAWSIPGGRGDNVRVIDVEYDWVTDHEDFPRNHFWGGRPLCPYDYTGTEHGTAVMGILAAPHNSLGISGITPNISYGLSTVCRPASGFAGFFVGIFSGERIDGVAHNVIVADAIGEAVRALRPGDVILIEQHTYGPAGEWVPMEYYQECFDVIRRATARNILVVEPAGNGGMSLDAPIYRGRFHIGFRNSQAIMVGACGAGDRETADFSNYGSRVDVQGWGDRVVTLGYKRGTVLPFTNDAIPRYYTDDFGGTSSASPIVAGAIASIQGARRAAGLPVLGSLAMKFLLQTSGTPQGAATSSTRPIGPLPNLRRALQMTLGITSPIFDAAAVYKITNVNSNKVVEVKNYSREDGSEICQWTLHGGDNQLWRIIPAADGYVYLRSVLSGKNLEVYGFSLDNGGRLAQWAPHRDNNQQWRIDRMSDGTYMLINRHSNKVVDVAGLSTENFAPIQQWDSWNGPNQKFRIERVR